MNYRQPDQKDIVAPQNREQPYSSNQHFQNDDFGPWATFDKDCRLSTQQKFPSFDKGLMNMSQSCDFNAMNREKFDRKQSATKINNTIRRNRYNNNSELIKLDEQDSSGNIPQQIVIKIKETNKSNAVEINPFEKNIEPIQKEDSPNQINSQQKENIDKSFDTNLFNKSFYDANKFNEDFLKVDQSGIINSSLTPNYNGGSDKKQNFLNMLNKGFYEYKRTSSINQYSQNLLVSRKCSYINQSTIEGEQSSHSNNNSINTSSLTNSTVNPLSQLYLKINTEKKRSDDLRLKDQMDQVSIVTLQNSYQNQYGSIRSPHPDKQTQQESISPQQQFIKQVQLQTQNDSQKLPIQKVGTNNEIIGNSSSSISNHNNNNSVFSLNQDSWIQHLRSKSENENLNVNSRLYKIFSEINSPLQRDGSNNKSILPPIIARGEQVEIYSNRKHTGSINLEDLNSMDRLNVKKSINLIKQNFDVKEFKLHSNRRLSVISENQSHFTDKSIPIQKMIQIHNLSRMHTPGQKPLIQNLIKEILAREKIKEDENKRNWDENVSLNSSKLESKEFQTTRFNRKRNMSEQKSPLIGAVQNSSLLEPPLAEEGGDLNNKSFSIQTQRSIKVLQRPNYKNSNYDSLDTSLVNYLKFQQNPMNPVIGFLPNKPINGNGRPNVLNESQSSERGRHMINESSYLDVDFEEIPIKLNYNSIKNIKIYSDREPTKPMVIGQSCLRSQNQNYEDAD